MFIGAHISTGISKVEDIFSIAETIDAQAIQIYFSDNQSFTSKKISSENIYIFNALKQKTKLKVYAHSSITINLSNPDERKRALSKKDLYKELKKADALECDGIVVHIGSHYGSGVEKGLSVFIQVLDSLIEKVSPNIKILLETMPEGHTQLGDQFSHIGWILKNSSFPEKIGVCLDTCHIYSAGYDIKEKYEEVLSEFDKEIGLDKIELVHANDAYNLSGEPEKHAPVGKGNLGHEVFIKLINDSRIKAPFILELPTIEEEKIKADIQLLKSLKAISK